MPRPKHPRRIAAEPIANEFRPKGIRTRQAIMLSLEEFEAIRLIDYEKMDQSQTAKIMSVSRHTVGRVLKAARGKLARAIVEALPLKVAGGCYQFHSGRGMGNGRGCQRRRGEKRGRGMGSSNKMFSDIQHNNQ
jgi:predicted DNA-binding protein (UPF0251 family)